MRRTSSGLRTLDRWLGIPLIAPFALAPKRREPDSSTVRRVGILKTAAIGDTLLLASMLGAIRKRYPLAEIVLVTGRDNAPAAELLRQAIDQHVVVSVRSPVSAILALRRLSLDVLIECGPWPRYDALLTVLSGARYRVGFRTKGQARHFGFDRVVDHSSNVHQLENLRRIAASIGATDFDAPHLRAPCVLDDPRLPPREFAVLHPWSGGYMGHVKEWPSDRWIELARRLRDGSELEILVSGGPGDVARTESLVAKMIASGVSATSIAGRYTLAELADVLVASAVVVSVNTGIMHLAALVGARTVSLEGPVPIHRWGPVGPHTRSVVTQLPGSGYLDLGFEYAGQRLDCMDGVSVDAVMDAVNELCATARSPRSPRVTRESRSTPLRSVPSHDGSLGL